MGSHLPASEWDPIILPRFCNSNAVLDRFKMAGVDIVLCFREAFMILEQFYEENHWVSFSCSGMVDIWLQTSDSKSSASFLDHLKRSCEHDIDILTSESFGA